MSRSRLALVLVHAVLIQVIVFAVRPTLSYAVLDLGSSPAFLGILTAVFAVPALVLALPAGHVIDRIGERTALVVGASIVVVATLLAFVGSASLTVLLLATVLLGAGQLFSVIGEQSLIGSAAGRGRSDSMFGFYGFAAALGQTLGPFFLALPGGTVSTPPVRTIFVLSAILASVMVIVSIFIRSSERSPGLLKGHMLTTVGSLLQTAGLPRALIAGAMVLASVDIFVAYAPLLGHERGLSTVVISGMLVARSAASMVSRLFLGRLSRLLGRRSLLVSSILISAVALGCLAIPLQILWAIALAAVYGFVVGICQPVTMSWISLLAPSGTRGLAMSLRLASNRLGQTVLPASVGTLAAATGSAGVLVTAGVMLVVAAWSGSAISDEVDVDEKDDGTASL